MPGMTGVELLARAKTVRPDAVGVLITAYTDVEALAAALNLGTVRGYITKPWDVAQLERQLMDAVLHQSDRFVQRVLEAMPDGLCVYDLSEGTVLYTNSALFKILGYAKAERPPMSTPPLAPFVEPEDAARIAAQTAQLLQAADGQMLKVGALAACRRWTTAVGAPRDGADPHR